jgi:hypothetical protein
MDGRLAPGDEGRYYRANPGESWAEVYARLTYPEEPWRFVRLLRPDEGALAAARKDVLEPWTETVTEQVAGRFTSDGPSSERWVFPLTLDGPLRVQLDGPDKARYDLRVHSLGKRRGKTTGKAAQDSLRWAAACREVSTERVTVTVVRQRGSGPYTLRITYAG